MVCKYDEAFTTDEMKEEGYCEDCRLDCPNAIGGMNGIICPFIFKCNCGRPIKAGQTECKCGMRIHYS